MVLLTTSVLVAQQNLVFNPGFENGTTEWTVMNSGNISTIQTDRQEGGWCCRIGADWGGVTQTVPVTANTFYNLSFWSKRLSSASNNVYVHVRCLNNADTILFKVLNGANLASTAWTQISKIFITPATTSQLEIFIYGDYGPCNTTLIDNFSLISSSTPVAVPVPASGNLLINGGFEAATPVGWTGGAIDKSTFRSGAQGLRVESAKTAYQDIAGTSENYYHADGFFKSGLSAGTSTFMVSALSQSKELLSTDSIIFTAISGFVSRSISFYTPVNTSFIRVMVDNMQGTGQLWMDDLAISAMRTVRIMPLGNSITAAANPGYRGFLYGRFNADTSHYRVNFVGTKFDLPPSGGDGDHEGHSGWTIGPGPCGTDGNEVGYTRSNLYEHIDTMIITTQPEIVLLDIGVNDKFQIPSTLQPDYNAATDGPVRLGSLIDRIKLQKPGVVLFVTSLLPNRDPGYEQYVQQFNSAVPAICQARPNVYYINGHDEVGFVKGDWSDNTHPSESGYEKFATVWYNHLKPYLDQRFGSPVSSLPHAVKSYPFLKVTKVNCTNDKMHITASVSNRYQVKITDLSAKLLLTLNGQGSHVFDLKLLPPGVYVFTYRDDYRKISNRFCMMAR